MYGAQGRGLSGLSMLASGLYGTTQPYDAAREQLGAGWQQAQQYQTPYWQAGVNALPGINNWLSNMQNPSGYINDLMGQYQQSPWAKFQTQQGTRAANNSASANGLIGSTPLAQANADYAQQISSQDMQSWLGNVLGINNMYGQGQFNLANMGQNSANSLTKYLGDYSKAQAEMAAAQAQAQSNDFWNTIGGIGSLASLAFIP